MSDLTAVNEAGAPAGRMRLERLFVKIAGPGWKRLERPIVKIAGPGREAAGETNCEGTVADPGWEKGGEADCEGKGPGMGRGWRY
jgi:hypothetical protein